MIFLYVAVGILILLAFVYLITCGYIIATDPTDRAVAECRKEYERELRVYELREA